MEQYSKLSTKELIHLKSYLELDDVKFKKELEMINQELIIRSVDFCKPISDVLQLERV